MTIDSSVTAVAISIMFCLMGASAINVELCGKNDLHHLQEPKIGDRPHDGEASCQCDRCRTSVL